MLYGMYISAAGALANSYRQDVIANNLANVDTVGFKRDLALFQARRTQAQQGGSRRFTSAMLEGIGGGTFALPTYTDFTPASLNETGDPFHVALTGKGFFQVQNGSQINYTRDGRFVLDKDNNQLVTVAGGLPVLDEAGQPIVLDPNIAPDIDATGFIAQGNAPVGRLAIVDFADAGQLIKRGENLYEAGPKAQSEIISAQVKQKYLENSGVDPIAELVNMIKTSRLFQTNLSLLQIQDQTLASVVNKLGSIT